MCFLHSSANARMGSENENGKNEGKVAFERELSENGEVALLVEHARTDALRAQEDAPGDATAPPSETVALCAQSLTLPPPTPQPPPPPAHTPQTALAFSLFTWVDHLPPWQQRVLYLSMLAFCISIYVSYLYLYLCYSFLFLYLC